ncbi:MAG: acyl-[ACP]--phospholipid O-acyltransferase [Rickettsiaceae bacterium]|nr:MAG: acyl-[ACP]--phospholipid O-acyltransferase [Rickettsiaceae bacterium]
MYSKLYLFKDRRFLPMFIVQFCGCLNDSIIKNALIILVTFKLTSILGLSSQLLVLLANALFIVPFILFASLAGQISDKYEKSLLVKVIKILEIAIVLAAVYGFLYNNLVILFLCVGAMGIHSTFFSPIKYSVLPDHLEKQELLGANGFVEAGTFVSILIGTMIGGLYNSDCNIVIFAAVIISLVGAISSFFLPKSKNVNQDIKINLNIYRETVNIIKYSYSRKYLYLSILGISWFWFIGGAILAQIPSLTKDTLGADESVANLFLATFSVGVGLGAFSCGKILKNEITTKYLFISAIALSFFSTDLSFATRISAISDEPDQLKNIVIFLSKKNNWRILIDLFCFSTIAGIYVVPLYAIMQYFSPSAHRSIVIAANNLMNSIFIAVSTFMLLILFHFDCSIPLVILLISLLNLVVAIYIYKLVPENEIVPFGVLNSICKFVFNLLYRVEVRGIENFHKAGDRSVIVANHISYIDPGLLAVYLPSNLIFAIDATIAQSFWVKPILKIVRTLPIDSNNPMAIKSLINIVKENKKIVIFPEGRITVTGSLMKVYEGPGMIADRADATILPVRIDGAQYTHFSKLKNKLRIKLFPKIYITILPPVKITPSINIDSKLRRKYFGQALYDIMTNMMFESSNYKISLFESLIDAAQVHGYAKIIIQDANENRLTYRELIYKSFLLSTLKSQELVDEQYVGCMLPNIVQSIEVIYSILAMAKTAVMINFTEHPDVIISDCKLAGIKTIYTSKKLIELNNLHQLINEISNTKIKISYIEDQYNSSMIWPKFMAFINSYCSQYKLKNKVNSKESAIIFFNQKEGLKRKAIVYSHQNIQASRYQISAKFAFGSHDIAFNTLPLFHGLGLMSLMLTSLNGIKTYLYHSPSHYRAIPEIIYYISATIIFGTNSLLHNYAKYAHPYDFHSLRYVFSAGKLRKETRDKWLNKYSIKILEGYGSTELAPIIAVNTPMQERPGTVGRLLPKIEYCIKPITGIALAKDGGKLYIKGPNIACGHIVSGKPGIVELVSDLALGEGWYDTGDIVASDEEGYITVQGKEQHLVAVDGQLIFAHSIENTAYDLDHTCINIAIILKNNQNVIKLLLFTDGKIINQQSWQNFVAEQNLPSFYLDITVVNVQNVPILAMGKIDYKKIKHLAQDCINQQQASD